MNAVVWVSALAVCVGALGVPPTFGAWLVAILVLAVRWTWRCYGQQPAYRDAAYSALAIYAASPEAALTLRLIDQPHGAVQEQGGVGGGAARHHRPVICPLVRSIWEASLSLSALAGAWVCTVALQAASSALWGSPDWPQHGVGAMMAAIVYATAFSAASVRVVDSARARWEAEAEAAAATTHGEYDADDAAQAAAVAALRRAGSLAGETAALAVASGWAWHHVLETCVPLLTSSSVYMRGLGAALVTTGAALATLVLRHDDGRVSRAATSRADHGDATPSHEASGALEVDTARGGYRPPVIHGAA